MTQLDISTRAMLVSLSITEFSCHKVDKAITEDVRMKNQAKKDTGNYNKRLLTKDAMAEIKRISGEARNLNYEMTLPWAQDGARILSAAMFPKWDAEMRRLKGLREMALRDFRDNYSESVEEARHALGGTFNLKDYPPLHQVMRKFTWEITVNPLPTAGDFRVDMSAAMANHLKAAIEKRTTDQLHESMRDVFQRVAKVVGHMAESLKDYKVTPTADGKVVRENPFRDTLVSNVRDLADLLPGLNITADPKLAEITTRIVGSLTKAEPDALREDGKLRKQVAKQAASILADMEGYL